MQITTRKLTEAEIDGIAARILDEDFNIYHEAIESLKELEEGDKAAVYAAARLLDDRRLSAAVASGEESKVTWALIRRTLLSQAFADYPKARIRIRELLDWVHKHPTFWRPLPLVAELYREQGHLAKARKYQEKAVHCARYDLGGDPYTAMMLWRLGIIVGQQKDAAYARKCFDESLALEQAACSKMPDRDPQLVQGNVFGVYYDCAVVMLACKQTLLAIPLLAAAQAIGQRFDLTPEHHHEDAHFQAVIAKARRRIDPEIFAAAWEAGMTMTPEQLRYHIASA